jgi:hypothetical protein
MVVSYFDDAHSPDESIRSYLLVQWLDSSRLLNEVAGIQELAEFKKRGTPKMWRQVLIRTPSGSILDRMRNLKR